MIKIFIIPIAMTIIIMKLVIVVITNHLISEVFNITLSLAI